MEAKDLIYESNELIAIDGNRVIFHYLVKKEDFQHLTNRIAQEMRLPYAFAVSESKETVSGIAVYGRYGERWFTLNNYQEFVIKKLLDETKSKIV
jgi:hypothetical protein